ncbi:hypothetical protein [Psychroserpens ponticola]|uniref:Uncharacterized protein n=1 Tax=Psychroserpens ponticola TaxID=2932268 RepID=A0ABY7S2E2_9FLAO|nr:hypothetical protein [Psychroserpens ponticola]WCO03170.1 hypothetical protein MUN68_006655 [Psychroserpens ponticola]
MRKLYLIFLLGISFCSFGQETLYKNYKVTNFIDFLNDDKHQYDFDSLTDKVKTKVKFLLKEKCSAYEDLSVKNQNTIDAKFDLVAKGVIPSIELKDCAGNVYRIDKSNVNNPATKKLIVMKEMLRAGTFGNSKENKKTYKAGLLFKENKLYVNLWPFKEKSSDSDSDDDQAQLGIKKTVTIDDEDKVISDDNDLNKTKDTREVLFYEIPDDHTAKLKFTEVTLTAITIPLKYRFRTNRAAIDASDEENPLQVSIESEEFSTSVNIAFFGGYTWGNTKFTHRKKIGNRTFTSKNTLGVFIGSSAVELKGTNTDITLDQPQGDREGTFGTISFGIGYVKSWNKISVGLFGGIDKGVGRVAKTWIYNGKPWLGIGVGYDLFKL